MLNDKRIWELRKEMVGQMALTGAKAILGAIMVPLEIVNHISPLYWIYKIKSYEMNPRVREIESLDYFDEVKEHARNFQSAIKEISQFKEEKKMSR